MLECFLEVVYLFMKKGRGVLCPEKEEEMIRQGEKRDLPQMLQIYDCARGYMKNTGNETQWGDHYPPEDLIAQDVEDHLNYVVERDGQVHGVFVFFLGEDPCYKEIQGQWRNDGSYGVIHRIAGDGQVHGVFKEAIEFAKGQCDNLRIDTHENNHTMQHLLENAGFEKCGIVYVRPDEARLAYHWVRGEE